MKKLIFASFLFVLMLLPVSSFGGVVPTLPPVNPACCQYVEEGTSNYSCNNTEFFCLLSVELEFIGGFEGSECNQNGLCEGFDPVSQTKNVPTLSEWGLIVMAGVMGLIGYMLLRRRKAAA